MVALAPPRARLLSASSVGSSAGLPSLEACDRIEYAETGAMYEYMNLCSGGHAQGLSEEELGRVVRAFNVDTSLFS